MNILREASRRRRTFYAGIAVALFGVALGLTALIGGNLRPDYSATRAVLLATGTGQAATAGQSTDVARTGTARAAVQLTARAPTVTPTPTADALPLAIRFENDTTRDALLITLQLINPEQIDHLRVDLAPADTPTTFATFESIRVAPEIRIPIDPARSGGFVLSVFAHAANQRILSARQIRFVVLADAAPLATMTPGPTAVASLLFLDYNPAEETLILRLILSNSQLIETYHVTLVNRDTGQFVKGLTFITPPYDGLSLPVPGLPQGAYLLRLRGFGAHDQPVTELSELPFVFCGPTPTPTLTPVRSPTPLPLSLRW